MSLNFIEYFVFVIFGVQSFLMAIDEFYFHWKRILPTFERIGHPIDTFFVLLCYGCVSFLSLNAKNVLLYGVLSLLSCLCIVKDEAVHKKHCTNAEQYLHAFLFLLHPLILFSFFLCWPSINHTEFKFFSFQSEFLKTIFYIQFLLSFSFFLYQIIYWNFILKDAHSETRRSCE